MNHIRQWKPRSGRRTLLFSNDAEENAYLLALIYSSQCTRTDWLPPCTRQGPPTWSSFGRTWPPQRPGNSDPHPLHRRKSVVPTPMITFHITIVSGRFYSSFSSFSGWANHPIPSLDFIDRLPPLLRRGRLVSAHQYPLADVDASGWLLMNI